MSQITQTPGSRVRGRVWPESAFNAGATIYITIEPDDCAAQKGGSARLAGE